MIRSMKRACLGPRWTASSFPHLIRGSGGSEEEGGGGGDARLKATFWCHIFIHLKELEWQVQICVATTGTRESSKIFCRVNKLIFQQVIQRISSLRLVSLWHQDSLYACTYISLWGSATSFSMHLTDVITVALSKTCRLRAQNIAPHIATSYSFHKRSTLSSW